MTFFSSKENKLYFRLFILALSLSFLLVIALGTPGIQAPQNHTAQSFICTSDQSKIPPRPENSSISYSLWNGFIDIINIAEIENNDSLTQATFLEFYNIDGSLGDTCYFTLESGQKRDIILNDLSSYRKNSYGIVQIQSISKGVDGRISYYRPSVDNEDPFQEQSGKRFDFVFNIPFTAPQANDTAVIFNTIPPSTNPESRNNLVANFLTLVNLDSTNSQSFTIGKRDSNGALINGPNALSKITLRPRERRDLEAGHLDPGPFNVGSVSVKPDKENAPYLALLSRYGHDAPPGIPASGFDFGFLTMANTGLSGPLYTPIKNALGLTFSAHNYIEVLNTSEQAAEIKLLFRSDDGTRLIIPEASCPGGILNPDQTVISLRLSSHAQRHCDASLVLLENQKISGTAEITSSVANSLVVQSMYYFRSSKGDILSLYGSKAVPIEVSNYESSLSWNRFLGMKNYVNLLNPKAGNIQTSLLVKDINGTTTQVPIDIAANGSLELQLSDNLGTSSNSYGTVQVPSGLITELTRVGSRGAASSSDTGAIRDSDFTNLILSASHSKPPIDSDEDGVPDNEDECPNDSNKTTAGACGCGVADVDSDSDGIPNCKDSCDNRLDSDNDGTPDCDDACQSDPNKIVPGLCGCGVSDTDADNDGTPNCKDLCERDPNKTAPGHCGCGVADTDSDNNGLPDCQDETDINTFKLDYEVDFKNLSTLTDLEQRKISFRRESNATYVDKFGQFRIASKNTPRLAYHPFLCRSNGLNIANNPNCERRPLGLQIERETTNLLPFSNWFFNWKSDGLSQSTQQTDLINIASNETTLRWEGAGERKLSTAVNIPTGHDTLVFSIYVKYLPPQIAAQNRDKRPTHFRIFAIDSAGRRFQTGKVDLYFQAINPGNFHSVRSHQALQGVRPVSKGWYRVYVAWKGFRAGNAQIGLELENNFSRKLTIWGAQLETATSPSSYIPTRGNPATRRAEKVSLVSNVYQASSNAKSLVAEVSYDHVPKHEPNRSSYLFEASTANGRLVSLVNAYAIRSFVSAGDRNVSWNMSDRSIVDESPTRVLLSYLSNSSSKTFFRASSNGSKILRPSYDPTFVDFAPAAEITTIALGGSATLKHKELGGYLSYFGYKDGELSLEEQRRLSSLDKEKNILSHFNATKSFSEDCSSNLDESVWVISSSTGLPKGSHICSWRPTQNVTVENGRCIFKTKKLGPSDSDWTTGHMWRRNSNKYGFFESKYKINGLPADQAYALNNAFWLMSFTETAKIDTSKLQFELDVNEGRFSNAVQTAVHHHAHRAELNGASLGFHHTYSGHYWFHESDLSTEDHKYALAWTPQELIWYVDDKVVRRSPNYIAHSDAYLYFSTALIDEKGQKCKNIPGELNNKHVSVDYMHSYDWLATDSN